ncbi:retropepsin-like aspartic protease [Alteromonas halophila]|nr:retropepsin-like aspartic protease [Alteromonas halophila]
MRTILLLMCFFTGYCSNVGAQDFPIKVAVIQSSAQTLYVDGILAEGISARFMIDTGSSVVVLNQSTFAKLRRSGHVVTKTEPMGARLASGQIKLVDRYLISSLSLGPDCRFTNVEVAVMDKSNNILGMSLLSASAPFAIYANPAQLRLSHCGKPREKIAVVHTE